MLISQISKKDRILDHGLFPARNGGTKDFQSLTWNQFRRFASKTELSEKMVLDTVQETVEAFHTAWKMTKELPLYRNNLKNREFGQEAAQIFVSGASEPRGPRRRFVGRGEAIALEQGASEDQKDAAKPTTPKTDSSGCFGIDTEVHEAISKHLQTIPLATRGIV